MIYHGTVHDGVVTFPPDVKLPDGLAVVVQSVEEPGEAADPAMCGLPGKMHNGVPMFPPGESGVKADLDLVNRLRDESP